ncbi:MAG: hypothetical protein GF350_08810 [Chitinivibrionales bacterium]|nr:hypothetical protein [Chitinivibrionales bacterium]
MRRVVLLYIIAANFFSYGLDGYAVTIIGGHEHHFPKWGRLLCAKIENDKIVSRKFLAESARSPCFDQSGSYIAFIDRSDGGWGVLSVVSVDSGAVMKIAEFDHPPQALWWCTDNVWYYDINWRSDDHTVANRLMKIYIDSSDATPVVRQMTHAKLIINKVGCFGDLSADAKWMHVRGGGCFPDDSSLCEDGRRLYEIPENDSNAVPIAIDGVGGTGCGNSVAPFGRFLVVWEGGHNTNNFIDIEGAEEMARFTNTEKTANLTDGDPVTGSGNCNGWSCNSDYWFTSDCGSTGPNGESGGDLVIANWKTRQAINVSSMQQGATRGDLWCSSQEDVHPDLYHFIEERSQRRSQWDALFGALTGQSVDTENLPSLRTNPAARNYIKQSGNEIIIDARHITGAHISVYAIDGSCQLSTKSNYAAVHRSDTYSNSGVYVVTVGKAGEVLYTKSFIAGWRQ